jgi:hypothetical protein
MGTERFFPRRESGRGGRVATHLHLMPKLRISGVIPLLPLVCHLVVDWENLFRLTANIDLKPSDCLRLIRYLKRDYELREYQEYIKTNGDS